VEGAWHKGAEGVWQEGKGSGLAALKLLVFIEKVKTVF